MTDLERIHFIEKTFGFKLYHVPIEKLATENKFYTVSLIFYSLSEIEDENFFYKGTRNYSTDSNGNVIGLALDFSPYYLLPENFLSGFRFLKHLRLKNVLLTDVSFLKDLKNITSLDLSSNNLSDASFLKEFKGITSLDLSSNNLNDVSFLKEFKEITSLNLSSNILSDVSFLKELKGITSLDLSSNILGDVSFLKELKGITSLDLSDNILGDISFLRELKGITSLYLSSNKLSDVSFLRELKGITSLNLSSNSLIDVSFLKELKGITSLYLSFNKLSDVSFLRELKGITSLDLRNNNLSDVSFLSELKGITSLDLSDNNLSDVSFLSELKGITSLFLSENNLRDVSSLKEIKGLTSLDLRNNILNDVSFLKELKGITSLDLSDNNLSDVSFLKELKNIASLYLSSNILSDLSFLKELKGITSLDLRNNSLSDVSFLKELKGITSLDLSDNTIVNPPISIVDGGIEAIQEYFRQSEKYEIEKAYEAKILIVGESGVGKTTLMELLFNPKHPVPSPESAQPSTVGVGIRPDRLFKHPDKKLPDIKTHIWDFGGQDIQHMLHQYFLTDDCMYILLADESTDSAHYEYWFNVINLSGKNSPILVLLNKHRGQNAVIPFDAKLYKETFPNLKILDLGEIDLGNLDNRWDDLINELAFNLSKLPIVGQQTLKPWKTIRKEIEKLRSKKYILLEDFDEICYRNGLEEERDARFLLSYLHKIGFVLNYEEDTLKNTIFLDPNWITHAIYDVLSDAVIINKNGQFKKDQLFEHWQSNICDKKHIQAYSLDECNYLLNLMLKNHFEVCYPLESKPSYYMVPTKLPNRKPEHEFGAPNNLRFRYQYTFIPDGLLSRLIVRMHEYIEEEKVWLTGAIFHKDECTAVVLQQETGQEDAKYIGISINGAELYKCQKFLRDIRREVEHIHKIFPYIKYSEMIVCNCSVCKNHQTPNSYAYENLQTHLDEKEQEIFCTVGNQKVDIRQMINEVYLPEDFDRDGQKKPIETKPEIEKKTIRIFLASSIELSKDKKEFEIFINRKNKEYQKQGIFLKLVMWEDSIDAMSATRLQDEYSKTIAVCDIFVSLFHTTVGRNTNEEFEKTFGKFKSNGKPLVYTFFNDTAVNISKITPEIITLLNFKQKLSELGHFHTIYNNIDDLKNKFVEQLEKVMEKL